MYIFKYCKNIYNIYNYNRCQINLMAAHAWNALILRKRMIIVCGTNKKAYFLKKLIDENRFRHEF